MKRLALFFSLLVLLLGLAAGLARAAAPPERPGDRMLAAYFAAETAKLRDACLTEIRSIDDWKSKRDEYRRQLLEMLGLESLPERTELKATITGRVEREDFAVENLHFQSRPGLYVTANLYLPKGQEKPAPAILYVCGHGGVKIDGVSYGNKVSYQHHGEWFARNGYVCLTIDSLQLGEIESIHHGTYRYNMWWWNNHGYTPAGVEAWNCVRALDYLQSRKEVDGERLGVTGRSGGGAYSWWIAAIDDRIKAAAPVAGITDLENHVVDGTVEGHCDCMFFVNTYRWDYPLVAALVAPRALLLENSDTDGIFPLNGVIRTHAKVKQVYQLHKAAPQFGLVITPGPHKDTQDLQVPAFRWFNKHLKGQEPLIGTPAEKLLTPAELKVFAKLPEDERNTTIHETFTQTTPPAAPPADEAAWRKSRQEWLGALRTKVFRGWPEEDPPLGLKQLSATSGRGLALRVFSFTSQEHVPLKLYVVQPQAAAGNHPVALDVVGDEDWPALAGALRWGFPEAIEADLAELGELPPADEAAFQARFKNLSQTIAFAVPRGIGPSAWNPDEKKQTQIRRRFMLLGQTLDGMRAWDTRRAIQAVRAIEGLRSGPLEIRGRGVAAGIALYASLFEPPASRLVLVQLPPSHREGPILLNVRRFLDMPEALAMAAERSPVVVETASPEACAYAVETAERLGWKAPGGAPRVNVVKTEPLQAK